MSLREWEHTSAWDVDGAHTAASWLTHQLGTTRGSAQRMLRLSRRLHDYPAVAHAVADGRVSIDKAEVLLSAFTPKRAKHATQWMYRLIEHACRLSVDNTRTVIRRWNA